MSACLVGAAACASPPAHLATPAAPSAPTAITREQAVAALGAARGLIAQHEYARARAASAAVIPDAERWGWLDVAADGHFLGGEVLDRERKPREAADAYARAYDASRRLGDAGRGLHALNALTNALLDGGAYDKAREAATEAYRLALRQQDVDAEATAQNNIAEAQRLAGRLSEAREGYERALGLARQARDRAAEASILLNLGVTERRAGRLDQARVRFAEARDLARSLDDARASAYAEWNLDQIDQELRARGGQR